MKVWIYGNKYRSFHISVDKPDVIDTPPLFAWPKKGGGKTYIDEEAAAPTQWLGDLPGLEVNRFYEVELPIDLKMIEWPPDGSKPPLKKMSLREVGLGDDLLPRDPDEEVFAALDSLGEPGDDDDDFLALGEPETDEDILAREGL